MPIVSQGRRWLLGIVQYESKAPARLLSDRHEQHGRATLDQQAVAGAPAKLDAVWRFQAGIAAHREERFRTRMGMKRRSHTRTEEGPEIFGCIGRSRLHRKRTDIGDVLAIFRPP